MRLTGGRKSIQNKWWGMEQRWSIPKNLKSCREIEAVEDGMYLALDACYLYYARPPSEICHGLSCHRSKRYFLGKRWIVPLLNVVNWESYEKGHCFCFFFCFVFVVFFFILSFGSSTGFTSNPILDFWENMGEHKNIGKQNGKARKGLISV